MNQRVKDPRRVACSWILLSCLSLFVGLPSAPANDDRPNIILVMADDLGWGDVQSFNPASPIMTPHLDAMCQQGIKLTRFYAGAPVCSPTRGSCLTGRHPSRYEIPTANAGHLREGEFTLAQALKKAGYRTGHFGKWHLGTLARDYSGKGPARQPEINFCTPGMRGFDEWFSTEFAVATWDPYDPAHSHLSRNQPRDPRALYWLNGVNVRQPLEGCDSQLIMDHALEFLRQAFTDSRPALAVIWFHAPHQPVIGGPDFLARYAQHPNDQRHYYAVVTAMDQQVGRLREELRAMNQAENTLIWFCSDNGPEGNPGPAGTSQGSAASFRGRKRSLYEGGVRVPAVIEWPARIAAARETNVPCVTSDFLPTILALLKVADALPDRPYDGIDLTPLIAGQMATRPRPIGFQFGQQASWVENRFKLVHNQQTERLASDNGKTPIAEYELYDLQQDPSETSNLAASHPEVVAQMRRDLEAWQESCRSSARGDDY